jgi:class 3 adenylate cyclase
LHIVLPFARAEFVKWSVAPAGPAWLERFDRCLSAASSIRFATDDAYLGDDVLFRYGAELAMGLALLRARYLDAEVRQLTVWDRQPSRGAAGTAIDVATWLGGDRAATLVSPAADPRPAEAIQALSRALAPGRPSSPSPRSGHDAPREGRVLRAMLFGDVRGFSVLTDEQLPVFAARVLGALAAAMVPYREHVWHVNTWGDAIFLVLSDAPAAAACALALQDAMASVDLRSARLPEHLALRLGGHVGPVFPYRDPVVERPDFIGSHVSRTARIEPVTPPGAVYVTEPFAAALVLSGQPDLACDYVGHMPAAKAYGRLRMYRLRRRPRGGVSPDS